jgi:uncharacterized protein
MLPGPSTTEMFLVYPLPKRYPVTEDIEARALEHYTLMEIMAHRSYSEIEYEVNFWRTKSGLEVDFIPGRGEVAVEVKGNGRIDKTDLYPLKSFSQEYHPKRAYLVCNERRQRVHENIRIVPWRDFLAMLWGGDVIS